MVTVQRIGGPMPRPNLPTDGRTVTRDAPRIVTFSDVIADGAIAAARHVDRVDWIVTAKHLGATLTAWRSVGVDAWVAAQVVHADPEDNARALLASAERLLNWVGRSKP